MVQNIRVGLIILFLAGVCSATTPEDVARWKIPGERKTGQCAKYAVCLNYVLFQKGIESKMLAYDWAPGESHALVFFQFSGQWYGIDNESDRARPLSGDTDLARARSFDKRAYAIRTNFYHGKKVASYLKGLKAVLP